MPMMPDNKPRHQKGYRREQQVAEKPADAYRQGGLRLFAALISDDLFLIPDMAGI